MQGRFGRKGQQCCVALSCSHFCSSSELDGLTTGHSGVPAVRGVSPALDAALGVGVSSQGVHCKRREKRRPRHHHMSGF